GAESATQASSATLAMGFDASDAPAIARAQEQLRADPDDLAAHVTLATAFLREARRSGDAAHRAYARDVVEAGLAKAPDAPRLRLLSVMLLLDAHRFEAVIDAGRALAAVMPHDPTPHLLVGDAATELGRYGDAEAAYEAAINLRPDLRSYNRVGYLRWLYGDFDGAVAALELALDSGSAREPESMAWCFTDLGAMHLRRGNTTPALAAAERALGLVPDYAPALTLRGRALAKSGALDDALAALSAAVDAQPSAEGLLILADVQRAAGQDATPTVEQARRLADHDPRPLAHYLARHGEASSRALSLAERELAARKNIWAWDTLALAAARTGNHQRAREAMNAALALGTVDAELTLHDAFVHAQAGELSEARRSFDAAVALDATVDPVLANALRARLGAS
ncbi:MAG: tetratricopeptide repeat protein, partial [Myxococcota bacterium]